MREYQANHARILVNIIHIQENNAILKNQINRLSLILPVNLTVNLDSEKSKENCMHMRRKKEDTIQKLQLGSIPQR